MAYPWGGHFPESTLPWEGSDLAVAMGWTTTSTGQTYTKRFGKVLPVPPLLSAVHPQARLVLRGGRVRVYLIPLSGDPSACPTVHR